MGRNRSSPHGLRGGARYNGPESTDFLVTCVLWTHYEDRAKRCCVLRGTAETPGPCVEVKLEVSQGGLLQVPQADLTAEYCLQHVIATGAGYPMIISEQLVVFGL